MESNLVSFWFTDPNAVIEEVTGLFCRNGIFQGMYKSRIVEAEKVGLGDEAVRMLSTSEQDEFKQLVRIGVWEGICCCKVEKVQKEGFEYRSRSRFPNEVVKVLRRWAHPDVEDRLLQAMTWSIFNRVRAQVMQHAKKELSSSVIFRIVPQNSNNGSNGPGSSNGTNESNGLNGFDNSESEFVEKELSYEEFKQFKRKKKHYDRLVKQGKVTITTTRILYSFTEQANPEFHHTPEEQIISLARRLRLSVDDDYLIDHFSDPEVLCMRKGL